MQIRVITLRYAEGLQGFPEDPLREATAGREVLEVREHFFVHGGVPHLAVLLALGDAPPTGQPRGAVRADEDPGAQLPEALRPLYRTLREWRNEEAKKAGIPSYVIFRNTQLAEICRTLPRSLVALRAIEGVGEATCAKYGPAVLALIPADLALPEQPTP